MGLHRAKVTAHRKTEWDCSLFKIDLQKIKTMKERLRETLSIIIYPSIYTFTASVLDSIKINQNCLMASSASFSLQFTICDHQIFHLWVMAPSVYFLCKNQMVRWACHMTDWQAGCWQCARLPRRQAVNMLVARAWQAGSLYSVWLLEIDGQVGCVVSSWMMGCCVGWWNEKSLLGSCL